MDTTEGGIFQHKDSKESRGESSNGQGATRSQRLRNIKEQFIKIENRYKDVLRQQVDLTEEY